MIAGVTAAVMPDHNYDLLRERYAEGPYDVLIQKDKDNWKRYKKEHKIGELDWKTWTSISKRKSERELWKLSREDLAALAGISSRSIEHVRNPRRHDRSIAIAHDLGGFRGSEVPTSWGSRAGRSHTPQAPALLPTSPPPARPTPAPGLAAAPPVASRASGELDAPARAILAALQSSLAPFGRRDLLAATGLPETAWLPSIAGLKDQGLVEQIG